MGLCCHGNEISVRPTVVFGKIVGTWVGVGDTTRGMAGHFLFKGEEGRKQPQVVYDCTNLLVGQLLESRPYIPECHAPPILIGDSIP